MNNIRGGQRVKREKEREWDSWEKEKSQRLAKLHKLQRKLNKGNCSLALSCRDRNSSFSLRGRGGGRHSETRGAGQAGGQRRHDRVCYRRDEDQGRLHQTGGEVYDLNMIR